MPVNVADIRANLNENIKHAARAIGRSKDRRKVFEAIYRGKQAIKTVEEISKATKLSRMRVLQEAGRLYGNQVVDQTKKNGDTAYKKDGGLGHHKRAILSIVDHPERGKRYPTKQEPKGTSTVTHTLRLHLRNRPRVTEVTVDDIDSFSRVRSIKKLDTSLRLSRWAESMVKKGIQRIVGETREYKDWGGEKHDLYTNQLRLKGRKSAAIALKGRATQGLLTPKKMGKNGDQIARLVGSAAQVFLIVYHSSIDESVVAQLQTFALAKALSGIPTYYGVVGGKDLNRLVQAYRPQF